MSKAFSRSASLKRSLVLVLAMSLFMGSAVLVAPSRTAAAQPAQLDQLRFCRDANGERLRGDIDILLLLDDTATLSGPNGQDPDNARFGIIRSFLEGVTQIETEQQVNFATYTFGADVTPVLDFEAITVSDLNRIDQVIRDNNPARQMQTDFIIAMSRASQALNARPAQNCRILLWFTDGNHDERDDFSAQADRRESENLRNAFCAPDGIADRIRAQRVNTFVLLLDPPPRQPLRLEASKDVFQVLTGDPNPSFPDENRSGRSPSDDCDRPLGEQLGKVFAVSQADDLVAIIADFLNELEDAGRITEESCPYPDGAVDSLALPDAHLVDWLSVTDFSAGGARQSPDASLLRVVSAEGETFSGEDVLVRFRELGPSARFRIRLEFREVLGPGWIVQADEAGDLCLRSRSVDLTFTLSSAEPGLTVLEPRGLPRRLWAEGQLSYFSSDGRSLTTEEALRSPEVQGRLRAESAESLSADGLLPARVIIDGAPVRSDDCSVIEIPRARTSVGGLFASVPEAPDSPLVSSECLITPATRGDDGGVLDFAATLNGLHALRGDDRCDVGDNWHVLIDRQRVVGTTQQLVAGGQPVRFAIASGVEPANEARDCIARALPPVEFIWQGQTVLIPARVTAEWERRGDIGIASGVTVLALAVALLLSYVLLLFLNWWLLRPPAGKDLRSFSVEATLRLTPRGDARISWRDRNPGDVTDRLRSGTGGKSKPLSFRGDAFSLRRRLWVNPLREPTLQLFRGEQRLIGVSEPRVGWDIPIDFPDLAILWTTSPTPATAEQEIPVTFTVVHSNKRSSTREFERLSERVPQLAMRLQQRLSAGAPKPGQGRSGSGPSGSGPVGSGSGGSGGSGSGGAAALRRRTREEKDPGAAKLQKRTTPKQGPGPNPASGPGTTGLGSQSLRGKTEGGRSSDGPRIQKRRRDG